MVYSVGSFDVNNYYPKTDNCFANYSENDFIEPKVNSLDSDSFLYECQKYKKKDNTGAVVATAAGLVTVGTLVALAAKGKLGPTAQKTIKTVWNSVKGASDNAWKNIKEFGKKALTKIKGLFGSQADDAIGSVVRTQKGEVAQLTTKQTNVISQLSSPVKGLPTPAQTAVTGAITPATTEAIGTNASKFNFASKFGAGELKHVGKDTLTLLNGGNLTPQEAKKAVKHLNKLMSGRSSIREKLLQCINERFGTTYKLGEVPSLGRLFGVK